MLYLVGVKTGAPPRPRPGGRLGVVAPPIVSIDTDFDMPSPYDADTVSIEIDLLMPNDDVSDGPSSGVPLHGLNTPLTGRRLLDDADRW